MKTQDQDLALVLYTHENLEVQDVLIHDLDQDLIEVRNQHRHVAGTPAHDRQHEMVVREEVVDTVVEVDRDLDHEVTLVAEESHQCRTENVMLATV